MHSCNSFLNKAVFLFLALLACATISFAQTGSIKGFVYDKSTGEPLSFAGVIISDTKFAAQTDKNGYYSISQLPGGEYNVIAVAYGYDTASKSVAVSPNRISSLNLYIRSFGTELTGVSVSAKSIQKQVRTNVGVTKISPTEIKIMPGAGGEPDLAQYLQLIPGVQFTGDQGGQLYIRGGSPAQTGILLDGVTIYNPFHTIGLYSIFETDAIRDVEVQSAGFSAEYGNRTSAILDVRTKDGNRNRLAGKLSVSPIMARAMLEGPLKKSKSGGPGGISFLLTAKHSYLDETSKSIYGSTGDAFKNGLPYNFTDLYGKITISGDNGSKINFFGFNFIDNAIFQESNTGKKVADFKWNAAGGGATFVVSPTGSSSLINGKFAYSKYHIDYDEVGVVPRSSEISGFEGAIGFTNFLPKYGVLKYGVEVSGLSTSLDYVNNNGFATTLDRNNTMAGVYALFRKNFGQKLIIEPSFRLQYYSAIGTASPEPRISAKYNLSPSVRLKGAAGYYTQNIISTKSDRDVVNFFTGFFLSPDDDIKDQNGKTVKNTLLTAYHLLGGIEVDVKGVEFNLEPWIKMFPRVIELNRNKGAINPQTGEQDIQDYQAGTGRATGLDLSAKYSKGRYFLWTAFSYQMVNNTYLVPGFSTQEPVTKQEYPTPFDRRFNMNLLGSYKAGKRREWEVSMRYNMGSPFPFTQTQGFYESLSLVQGGVATNYAQQNGNIGLVLSNDVNQGRLSWYHRVDISAKRKFQISKNSNLEATVAITNALDRNNIFYVDRVENKRVYQLPFFPSANLTWNF